MRTTEPTNKRPVKTAGYDSAKLHAKRDRKRREAEGRIAARAAIDKGLTPDAKLRGLYDACNEPGAGQCRRQIVRLQKKLAQQEFGVIIA